MLKVKGRLYSSCLLSQLSVVSDEDFNEQVPDPRRPYGARGLSRGAPRCPVLGRPAPELSRGTGRIAGGAARLCAVSLGVAPRQADTPHAGADRARRGRALP